MSLSTVHSTVFSVVGPIQTPETCPAFSCPSFSAPPAIGRPTVCLRFGRFLADIVHPIKLLILNLLKLLRRPVRCWLIGV